MLKPCSVPDHHYCNSSDGHIFYSYSDVNPAFFAAEKWMWDQAGAPVRLPLPLCDSCAHPSLNHLCDYNIRQHQRLQGWPTQSTHVWRHFLQPYPTTSYQQPPGEGAQVSLHDSEQRPWQQWDGAQLLPSSSYLFCWTQTAGGECEMASSGGGGGG